MTLHTRAEPGVIGYNGFNLYDENNNFIGDVTWRVADSGKVKASVKINGFKAIPKAIDPRDDDKYDFEDEDCIE